MFSLFSHYQSRCLQTELIPREGWVCVFVPGVLFKLMKQATEENATRCMKTGTYAHRTDRQARNRMHLKENVERINVRAEPCWVSEESGWVDPLALRQADSSLLKACSYSTSNGACTAIKRDLTDYIRNSSSTVMYKDI